MVNWEKEKSNIEKLIQEGVSYERIGREYHCTGNNIKKVARKLGIPLESRRIVNEKETFNKGCGNVKKCKHCGKPLLKRNCMFCSAECRNQYKQNELVELWKKGEIDGHMADGSTRTFVRRYLYEKNECKCQKCGFDKKNEYTNLPLNFSVYHHIGLYAYKSKFIETFTKLEPSPLEICESLEQLRAIYHGYKIKVGIVNSAPAPGIDTPEDVEKVINLLNNRKDLF